MIVDKTLSRLEYRITDEYHQCPSLGGGMLLSYYNPFEMACFVIRSSPALEDCHITFQCLICGFCFGGKT